MGLASLGRLLIGPFCFPAIVDSIYLPPSIYLYDRYLFRETPVMVLFLGITDIYCPCNLYS